MAETREAAYKAFDAKVERFEAKYLKTMACLTKYKEALLAFYDFPAIHRSHIRTTNAIEPTFTTVRRRTNKAHNCLSRNTTLAMVFKLVQCAEKRWYRVRGFELLADITQCVQFINGVKQQNAANRIFA